MAASTDIYGEHSQLSRPLAWSAGLHLAFATFVVLYTMFVHGFRGEGWGGGGGGDAMGATLVTSVPLPASRGANNKCAGNGIEGTVEVGTESAGAGHRKRSRFRTRMQRSSPSR